MKQPLQAPGFSYGVSDQDTIDDVLDIAGFVGLTDEDIDRVHNKEVQALEAASLFRKIQLAYAMKFRTADANSLKIKPYTSK